MNHLSFRHTLRPVSFNYFLDLVNVIYFLSPRSLPPGRNLSVLRKQLHNACLCCFSLHPTAQPRQKPDQLPLTKHFQTPYSFLCLLGTN